jgi:CRISPR-associated protein Cmx8
MTKKSIETTTKARAKPTKTAAKTVAKATQDTKPHVSAPMEIRYTLAELPSSQHRAGLAGLVLMTRWLDQLPSARRKGICEVSDLSGQGLTLRVDQAGMASLFDATYKASAEEQAYPAAFKNKEPLRIETVEVEVKGKTKTKTVYIYPTTIPEGAFLTTWDKTHTNAKPGLWVKLWRDMVWSILRGVPATRRPFEMRADGEATKDAAETWADLKKKECAVDLPSTYFLGIQSVTAEDVAFRDRARYQFLLHFWPFVAQIYVITIPDVAHLE